LTILTQQVKNEGNEFVVSDGKGVYQTGEQIITSKVSTVVEEAAKTEIRSISFDDESAIAQLSELQSAALLNRDMNCTIINFDYILKKLIADG
jgi:hypothetical protein